MRRGAWGRWAYIAGGFVQLSLCRFRNVGMWYLLLSLRGWWGPRRHIMIVIIIIICILIIVVSSIIVVSWIIVIAVGIWTNIISSDIYIIISFIMV